MILKLSTADCTNHRSTGDPLPALCLWRQEGVGCNMGTITSSIVMNYFIPTTLAGIGVIVDTIGAINSKHCWLKFMLTISVDLVGPGDSWGWMNHADNGIGSESGITIRCNLYCLLISNWRLCWWELRSVNTQGIKQPLKHLPVDLGFSSAAARVFHYW